MGYSQPDWRSGAVGRDASDRDDFVGGASAARPGVLSRRAYMLLLSAFTAAGIAFAAAVSLVSLDWNLHAWPWYGTLAFFVAVLLVGWAGVSICNASDSPWVSAFGYALVAGPLGLAIGPVLSLYQPVAVFSVFALTTLVVVVLGVVGALLPQDLASWGTWLLGALLILIGGQLIVPLLGMFGLPVAGALTLLDWVGVLLFAGYVIYDLNQAARDEYTLDNAVDNAMSIFLGFINLFIRFLSLFGGNK